MNSFCKMGFLFHIFKAENKLRFFKYGEHLKLNIMMSIVQVGIVSLKKRSQSLLFSGLTLIAWGLYIVVFTCIFHLI